MRYLLCLIIIIILFFAPRTYIYAESGYVLPYPSRMPGSFAYKFRLVYENLSRYWYFGSFGQFEYGLKMADRYLVEAKTLFEYKQYLLGLESLEKSNYYFGEILPSLKKAEKENKNISQKRSVLREAALKHIEYLKRTDLDTPDIFIWEPEKSLFTTLFLKKIIAESIKIRENNP